MPSRVPSRAGRRARTSSAFPCPPPWGRACASKWAASRPDRPERQTKGFPAVLLLIVIRGGRPGVGRRRELPSDLSETAGAAARPAFGSVRRGLSHVREIGRAHV